MHHVYSYVDIYLRRRVERRLRVERLRPLRRCRLLPPILKFKITLFDQCDGKFSTVEAVDDELEADAATGIEFGSIE